LAWQSYYEGELVKDNMSGYGKFVNKEKSILVNGKIIKEKVKEYSNIQMEKCTKASF